MRKLKVVLAASAVLAGGTANAAVFVVDAAANSSSGGSPLASLTLAAGQAFTVSADTNDLWSAGPLPRYSDANGLTGDRFATASDDSGQPAGTLIGIDFGSYTQDGFTAPFGALVGRIGTTYTLLGTSFSGVASGSGMLELFYWDSNNGDNFGTITFDISAVPEPASWALMVAGFGLIGLTVRRRRTAVVAA